MPRMMKLHGLVFESSENYVQDRPARCRKGMCKQFRLAVDILDAVAVCRECRENRVMTGSWTVV